MRLISLYVQGIPILSPFAFYAIPILICRIYLSPLIFKSQFLNLLIIMVQVSSNATSSKKIPHHRLVMYMYMYIGQMHVHRARHIMMHQVLYRRVTVSTV